MGEQDAACGCDADTSLTRAIRTLLRQDLLSLPQGNGIKMGRRTSREKGRPYSLVEAEACERRFGGFALHLGLQKLGRALCGFVLGELRAWGWLASRWVRLHLNTAPSRKLHHLSAQPTAHLRHAPYDARRGQVK
jgi:hypothetical protein